METELFRTKCDSGDGTTIIVTDRVGLIPGVWIDVQGPDGLEMVALKPSQARALVAAIEAANYGHKEAA